MILRPHQSHFGDLWASVNLAGRRGEAHKERQHLWSNGKASLLQEMVDVLAMPFPPVITDEAPTLSMTGPYVWNTIYYPTKAKWSQIEPHKTVVGQLGQGVSHAHLKNCPDEDQVLIKSYISRLGFTFVELGKHMSVQQCVAEASKAAFFVGICSGMSHLAHSVGLPMFIMKYKYPLSNCHFGKAFYECNGVTSLIDRSTSYMNSLYFTLPPCPAQQG